MTIGIYIASLNDSYQMQLWRHLLRRARERNVSTVWFCGQSLGSPDTAESTMNMSYLLAGPQNIDGLVVFSNTLGTFSGPEGVARLLENQTLPAVSLGLDLEPVTSVSASGAQAMTELTRHLIEVHGRRRFALVSGPIDHVESRERETAFRRTIEAAGLELDPELHFRGNFYADSGREAIQTFLARGKTFDAVVCLNDHMAIGALGVLRQNGFAVPDDISLTGFDDISEATWVSPPLSTIRQPLDLLASAAVDLVLDKIAHQSVPSRTIPCELVLRESCGCALPPPLPAFDESDADWNSLSVAEEAAKTGNLSNILMLLRTSLSHRWGQTGALGWWRRQIAELKGRVVGPKPHWADQALTWLADEELRWERESRLTRDERTQKMRKHLISLPGIFRLEAIVRYAEDHFAEIGIPRFFLILFDKPAQSGQDFLPATSLWLTTNNPQRQLQEVPFETAQLIPPLEDFSWGTFGWLAEPLVYQNEAMGYFLLECGVDDTVAFETLKESLSTAIKGALLMEEVQGHKENLIRQVKARARELQAVHKDLQEVSNRTMQGIGQAIHDDLAQHLVGISMLAAVAEETMHTTGTLAAGAMAEIRSLIDRAVQTARQFARTLYPPGLEEHGLVSALEELVGTMGRTMPKGTTTFTVDGDCRPANSTLGLQLYRIVQESLANAIRHSGSEVILVRLVRRSNGLLAEVRDFGRGLPPGALGSGMGTRILQDRAEDIGAKLEIYNLDPGVCVSCFLPDPKES